MSYMNDILKVGIVGNGLIGNVLGQWLLEYTKHEVYISDPPKGLDYDLSNVDICFISIHIPTDDYGEQDLVPLLDIIKSLPDVPIFIRTTIELGSINELRKWSKRDVHFMPEFLSERTAYEDFANQTLIFTAHEDLLIKIFPNREYITMSDDEAIMAKYTHNTFGAMKVAYFTGISDVCRSKGLDYNKVVSGSLISGYISDDHTKVPHKGYFGYGGKCLPKDIKKFHKTLIGYPIGKLLYEVQNLNDDLYKTVVDYYKEVFEYFEYRSREDLAGYDELLKLYDDDCKAYIYGTKFGGLSGESGVMLLNADQEVIYKIVEMRS